MDKLDYTVAKNKYGKYCIPESSKHRTVAGKLLGGFVYEEETIQYILDHRGDGAVIHAGTYVGDFLPAISANNRKVYAFEAVKENYEATKITLDLNFGNDHQTKLYYNALGSVDDEIIKIVTKDWTGKSIGCASTIESHIHKANENNYEEVATITIDSVVPEGENITLIHLDIEGFEEEALKGAMQTIRKNLPILLVECWHDHMLQTDFYKKEIYPLGYQIVEKMHENVILRIS